MLRKHPLILVLSLAALIPPRSVRAQKASVFWGSVDAQLFINRLVLKNRSLSDILYWGLGSGFGEAKMNPRSHDEQISIMSTPLSKEFCERNPRAGQLAFAQDDLVFVRNNRKSRSSTCDTALVDDVSDYQSQTPSWAEAIQLIYGGKDGKGDRAACTHTDRVKLINNWHSLWSDNCSDGACTKLKYAFRAGDFLGSTSFLKSLVGIERFCNGLQHEDKDPLRTNCGDGFDTGGMEYCPNGDLGVVQAVVMNHQATIKDRLPCQTGNFEYAFASNSICADGTIPHGGFLCLYPRDCSDRFGCRNSGLNGSTINPFMDGRLYNYLHTDETVTPYASREITETLWTPDGSLLAKYGLFSIYASRVCEAGQSGHNATTLMGCLVDTVDCSIGFGGRSILKATRFTEGGLCGETGDIIPTTMQLNNQALGSPNYPFPRRNTYLQTKDVPPTFGGKIDCHHVNDVSQQSLCEYLNDDDDQHRKARQLALEEANLLPIPGGPRTVRCGD